MVSYSPLFTIKRTAPSLLSSTRGNHFGCTFHPWPRLLVTCRKWLPLTSVSRTRSSSCPTKKTAVSSICMSRTYVTKSFRYRRHTVPTRLQSCIWSCKEKWQLSISLIMAETWRRLSLKPLVRSKSCTNWSKAKKQKKLKGNVLKTSKNRSSMDIWERRTSGPSPSVAFISSWCAFLSFYATKHITA